MRAIFTKAWSEVRRRRLQSVVIVVMVALAIGMPAGVRIHHWLVTQVGKAIGNTPPPLAFDVLHPMTLYPLGLTGLAIALAGAFLPARRAARSRTAEILRSE